MGAQKGTPDAHVLQYSTHYITHICCTLTHQLPSDEALALKLTYRHVPRECLHRWLSSCQLRPRATARTLATPSLSRASSATAAAAARLMLAVVR